MKMGIVRIDKKTIEKMFQFPPDWRIIEIIEPEFTYNPDYVYVKMTGDNFPEVKRGERIHPVNLIANDLGQKIIWSIER